MSGASNLGGPFGHRDEGCPVACHDLSTMLNVEVRAGSELDLAASSIHGNRLSLNGPLLTLQSDVNRSCEISRSRSSVRCLPERRARKRAILRSTSFCRDSMNLSMRRRMMPILATADGLAGGTLG